MPALNLKKTYKSPDNSTFYNGWVQNIPTNWDMSPIRSLFKTKKEVVDNQNQKYTLLRLAKEGVSPKLENSSGKNPENYDTYQVFNPSDLVFCLFDYDVTPRTIGYVYEKGMLTGAYTRLIPKNNVNSKYYYYLFLFLDQRKELLHLCTGLRSSLSKQVFWPMLMPKPDRETQDKIVNFLDKKTILIDKIIEKKQRLIGLLQEKRSALITHAVTQGLDPKVKIKSSGIEFVSDIPQTWDIKKIKYISVSNKKSLSENTPEEYEFDYIDISNVNSEGKILEKQQYLFKNAPSRARRLAEKGDTIISTVRTYLKAMAKAEQVKDVVFSTGFAIVHPTKINPEQLFWSMQSEPFISRVVAYSTGVSYPSINESTLTSFYIPIPTVAEQDEIDKYLKNKSGIIDTLVEIIKCQIEKLSEYRSSLIYHTVTGKIKI